MAAISALITELRNDIEDTDSSRFTDARLLPLFKKAIRRANRVCQRNGLSFAKKSTDLSTVALQNYIDISTVTDFDVHIGLFDSDGLEVELLIEAEFQYKDSSELVEWCYLDQTNSKMYLKGTPGSVQTLTWYYYPAVDPSAYTVNTSTPWGGRLDDILMEYVRIRALNIDEYDLTFDTQLLTDMENQILGAYINNSATCREKKGWNG